MPYTTTSYGTWNSQIDSHSLTLEQWVEDSLGDGAKDFDTDAIATEVRNALTAALPDRVSLHGSEFIGPAYEQDCDWDGELDIREIWENLDIDFGDIAERHEFLVIETSSPSAFPDGWEAAIADAYPIRSSSGRRSDTETETLDVLPFTDPATNEQLWAVQHDTVVNGVPTEVFRNEDKAIACYLQHVVGMESCDPDGNWWTSTDITETERNQLDD